MIVPFWADVDTRRGGTVYYRESSDSAQLQKASQEVSQAFPTLGRINLGWIFIVTWAEVAFFGAQVPSSSCPGRSLRNTFQVRFPITSQILFINYFIKKLIISHNLIYFKACHRHGWILLIWHIQLQQHNVDNGKCIWGQ